jgi:membrane protease YdiL (CAAX protease family)
MNKITIPIISFIIALVITVTMDFTGFFNFSALPLFVISLISWVVLRLSKTELGLVIGKLKYYGLALLYPLFVMGIISIVVLLSDDYSIQEKDWTKFNINLLLGSTIGTLMVLLTEEGFFRGWLWGAFIKSGMNETKTLYLTSILFMIWHISAVTSGTDYGLPITQIPVYLINVILLGLIWGLMRSISGSAFVSAFSHAVWNAFAYGFFGFGQKVGALGIANTEFFGPEVGYLGIILNGSFLMILWQWQKKRK